MTRRAAWLLAAVSLVAGAGILITRDEPNALPRRDPDTVYRMLLASDFSDVGREHGFTFEGVHGMLPPEEAERERDWIVYAGFGGPPGRHRIAYQVVTPNRRDEMEESLRALGRCRHEVEGWECFGSVRDVFVQGEAVCLEPRCTTTKRQAETLLRLGIEHLQSVLAS
jgi:hypothetical protein